MAPCGTPSTNVSSAAAEYSGPMTKSPILPTGALAPLPRTTVKRGASGPSGGRVGGCGREAGGAAGCAGLDCATSPGCAPSDTAAVISPVTTSPAPAHRVHFMKPFPGNRKWSKSTCSLVFAFGTARLERQAAHHFEDQRLQAVI